MKVLSRVFLTTWTQEYVVGQHPWVVEAAADADYPIGAADGNYRLLLRNTNTVTQGYKTRLITPVMNLKDVINPILILSHAQMQRTGDIDTLKVFYRTSESAEWILFKTFGNKTRDWETDTLDLVVKSATYQIAFEASDNFGWGVVLDNIIVRPLPTCTTPTDIQASKIDTASVTLSWLASFDADSFRVVFSTEQLSIPLESPAIALDTIVYDYTLELGNVLSKNTTYHVYISSFCANEISDYGQTKFTTQNLVGVPYAESFDLSYVSGLFGRIPHWTYGTNIVKADGEKEFLPFVNQNIASGSWNKYSYSNTTCLVFSGACDLEVPIAPEHYVYAATPQIAVEDISTLEVSFWGTSYTHVGDAYASGLIVGVMSTPDDFSTFVPVDTVYATGNSLFNKYIVSLAGYNGDGKYIVFASNFTKENIFFLDNITITEQATVAVPDVQIKNILAQRFDLHTQLKGAQAVNVVVANVETDAYSKLITNPAQLSAENVLVRLDNQSVSNLPLTIALPAGNDGKFVEVYVQAVNGANVSEWALPVKVLVPTLFKGEDLVIDFEENDKSYAVNSVMNFNSINIDDRLPYTIISAPTLQNGPTPRYPEISAYTNYGYNSEGQITLNSVIELNNDGSTRYKQAVGDYIVLPQVDNIQDVILSFWIKRFISWVDNAKVNIGVMTDPYDIRTFEKVGEYAGIEDYTRCVMTFADYKGKGKFICIQAIETPNIHTYNTFNYYQSYYTSCSRIDHITISSLGNCVEPTNIEATPSPSGIALKWTAMNMTQWQVGIFADKTQQDTIVWAAIDSPYFAIDTLQPHTDYYYQISTICALDTISSLLASFTTSCAIAETLPYIESFEDYTSGSNIQETPYCWTMPHFSYSGSYYPYILSPAANNTIDGQKILNFGSMTVTDAMYFALPKMDAKLDCVQLSFWTRSALNSIDTLYLGIMTDAEDTATFVKTHDIITSTTWQEVIVNFANYTGADDHIAFVKKSNKRQFYIDKLIVESKPNCEKIQGVSVGNITTDGASIGWNKSDATKWEVLVSSKELVAEELAAVTTADSTIILVLDQVTNNPYTFTSPKFEPNTLYYVYVRGLCSETSVGAWSNMMSFRTTCTPTSLANAVEDFSSPSVLDCWTIGCREGSSTPILLGEYLWLYNTAASEGSYAIMPPLDIENIQDIQISFDAHGGTSSSDLGELTVGIISNASDLSTFVPVIKVSLPHVSSSSKFEDSYRYTNYVHMQIKKCIFFKLL